MLQCVVIDSSGAELIVEFMGRKQIPGIRTGAQIIITGMVGERRNRLAMLNPLYELMHTSGDEAETAG
jgi:hypothetical protein